MLEDWVSRHCAEIQKRWFEHVTRTYPEETSRFLMNQRDQFANPVGARFRAATAQIVEGLAEGRPVAELVDPLDEILRVRALQDMSPSAAVGFILELKRIVRQLEPAGAGTEGSLHDELATRVDELMLAAFDVYSSCRDQVHKVQVAQIRNRSLKMMERLNEWRDRRDRVADPNALE